MSMQSCHSSSEIKLCSPASGVASAFDVSTASCGLNMNLREVTPMTCPPGCGTCRRDALSAAQNSEGIHRRQGIREKAKTCAAQTLQPVKRALLLRPFESARMADIESLKNRTRWPKSPEFRVILRTLHTSDANSSSGMLVPFLAQDRAATVVHSPA